MREAQAEGGGEGAYLPKAKVQGPYEEGSLAFCSQLNALLGPWSVDFSPKSRREESREQQWRHERTPAPTPQESQDHPTLSSLVPKTEGRWVLCVPERWFRW